jgi:NDP-sugar pyrophosphorylase family protein
MCRIPGAGSQVLCRQYKNGGRIPLKAVVMAGGKGTRLRPLTCDRPKPMVPVVNRPMLEHVIDLLKLHGFSDIFATLYYMPEVIQDYFGQGDRLGVSMHYAIEDTPLGTAGSVKACEHYLDSTFLVISGDALTDINLGEAVEFHKAKGAIATIVLTHVTSPLEYGVVITDDDGRITRFLEKPSWSEVFSDTVNTGIYVLEPEALRLFDAGVQFDFSKNLFPLILKKGLPLFGYVADGYWSDVGNIEQYRQTHYDILQGLAQVNIPGEEIARGITDIALQIIVKAPVAAVFRSVNCADKRNIESMFQRFPRVGDHPIMRVHKIRTHGSPLNPTLHEVQVHLHNPGDEVRRRRILKRDPEHLYPFVILFFAGLIMAAGDHINVHSVLD